MSLCRQGGQSLAEFAIVAPIFFLLVFGIIQVGLVLAAQNGLVDGVRDAARRAATYRVNEASFDSTVFSSICGTIRTELNARLANRIIGYQASGVASTISYEWQQNPESGQYFLIADVRATYANPLYVPLISWFLDSSDGATDGRLTLSAGEQMRIENPALTTPTSTATQTC